MAQGRGAARDRAMMKTAMCHTECGFNWKGEEELPKDFRQYNGMIRIPFAKIAFPFFGRMGSRWKEEVQL